MTETRYWYTFDFLPLTGFVVAESAEQAEAAALDDALDRLRSYLAQGKCTLEPIIPMTEVARDDAHSV